MFQLLFVLTGCGDGATYHCDFQTAEDPEARCQERQARVVGSGAITSEAFIQTCELVQGSGADGPCPSEGIVAGCDITAPGSGETVVDWYYAPETRESVEADCASDGGDLILR